MGPVKLKINNKPSAICLLFCTIFFLILAKGSFAQEVVQKATDSPVQNILELDCYGQDVDGFLNLKIDLDNKKVISPEHLSWGKYKTSNTPHTDRIYLQDAAKDPLEVWSIFQNNGRMSVCQEDYVAGHCDIYRCYNKNQMIFEPAKTMEKTSCSSLNALYRPSLRPETLSGYPHDYRLRVEVINSKGPTPQQYFIIETLDKKTKEIITSLKLKYACGGGDAASCNASFMIHSFDGKESYKAFDVVALDGDFIPTSVPIALPNYKRGIFAPYALIFPGLSRDIYQSYLDINSSPNIQYFTKDKVRPPGIDVWRFEKCR